jgi:hypothetical protein
MQEQLHEEPVEEIPFEPVDLTPEELAEKKQYESTMVFSKENAEREALKKVSERKQEILQGVAAKAGEPVAAAEHLAKTLATRKEQREALGTQHEDGPETPPTPEPPPENPAPPVKKRGLLSRIFRRN